MQKLYRFLLGLQTTCYSALKSHSLAYYSYTVGTDNYFLQQEFRTQSSRSHNIVLVVLMTYWVSGYTVVVLHKHH